MDSYRVISDLTGVPEMTDLRATYVKEPGRRDGGMIMFDADYTLDPRFIQLDRAVGARCVVVRTRDGRESRKGGAVETISPPRVMLDGGPWE
jgi:hypothetical protein